MIMVHVVDLKFNVGVEYMYLTLVNPYSVTFVIYTLIFQWYVVKCGSKNNHQKGMCFTEIGLQAKNMITILGSIVNTIEGSLFDHSMSLRIFTLIMNKIFI